MSGELVSLLRLSRDATLSWPSQELLAAVCRFCAINEENRAICILSGATEQVVQLVLDDL